MSGFLGDSWGERGRGALSFPSARAAQAYRSVTAVVGTQYPLRAPAVIRA